MVHVSFKKHSSVAQAPYQATEGSAGFDLVACAITGKNSLFVQYDTCIAVAIPQGYVGLVYARSSVSATGWMLSNSTGVIDSDYRGTIKVRFSQVHPHVTQEPYKVGDRIAQLVIVPSPQTVFEEVRDLDDTYRGAGGFGSTET